MPSPSLALGAFPTHVVFPRMAARVEKSKPSRRCFVKASSSDAVEPATDGTHAAAATSAIGNCVTSSSLTVTGTKYEGKVRDTYLVDNLMIAVVTDRQSAFDRHLAHVPFKGAVLNLTSAWWFNETKDIVPNAWLCSPDPNVTIMRKCEVFPIEFVVRGYLTGSTSTSLWTHYKTGGRDYCGNKLDENMVKNQKLPCNVVTPTTKEKEHDRPISLEDIVGEGWMKQADLDYCVEKTLAVFEKAQTMAAEKGKYFPFTTFRRLLAHTILTFIFTKKGLILVDTKYEFGRDAVDGTIRLIDEINTPDSSRYWLNESYQARHTLGKEPEMIDKEFLRLWFADRCDPYNDKELPAAPTELVVELSQRYIKLFEMITGTKFVPPDPTEDVAKRVQRNVDAALKELE